MDTLRRGWMGPSVKELQLKLNQVVAPMPPLTPDGIFGPKTEGVVRRFQTQKKLVVDGVVGPKTRAALFAAPGPGPIKIPLNYVVPGMKLIPQDKTMSCWFASAQMLIQWRRELTKMSEDGHPDPSESDKWSKLYSDNTGITNERISDFAKDMGFLKVPPMSPTPAAIQGWLMANGPLWVNGVKHITVIAGIRDTAGGDQEVLVYDPALPAKIGGEWRSLAQWYVLNKHSGRDTDAAVEAVFLHLPPIGTRRSR